MAAIHRTEGGEERGMKDMVSSPFESRESATQWVRAGRPKASGGTDLPPSGQTPPRQSSRRERAHRASRQTHREVTLRRLLAEGRGRPRLRHSWHILEFRARACPWPSEVISQGLGNISAVVLLPFFVYSLNLGLTGAALATIASQYVGMFLVLWSLSKRAVLLPPKFKDLEFVGYIKSGMSN